MNNDFRDPIFRGCTRPATFAGVPLVPMITVTGLFMLISVWTFYLINGYVSLFVVITYIPLYIAMRAVTRKDEQRLRQMFLRSKMRYRQRALRPLWGAVSYSPLRYKERKSHEI